MAARKDIKKAGKIRSWIRKWDNQNKYNNTHYHEMTTFIKGEQWKDDEAKLFETYKKIPLTVNKIRPLSNHMIGEQRKNTPNLQILPTKNVDERTAAIREALIKEISLNSRARVVYQNAFGQQVNGGFSAALVFTEYDNDENFDQNIVIRGFKDPTKCFWDLGAESPCKTDGMYCGFRTTMSRERFRQLYGKDIEKKIGSETTDITDTDSFASTYSDENAITVIDLWERKSKLITLYQLSNGKSVRQEELDRLEKVDLDGTEILMYEGEPVTIYNERTFPEYKVVHSKWGGDYELEKTDFPSKQLPQPFIDQDSYFDKNGKQVCGSFFKDARDTQRYINYLRTQTAYLIKISRYDQYLASKQNVKSPDTAAIWRDPATVQGALLYDESPNGNKPEQQRPPELAASLMMQYDGATADLQMTTGMYNTQIGDEGNEISRVAIDARTRRGSNNTYIPRDNLNRAIWVIGEIINEMIPKVYDSERLMKLDLKDTGKEDVILNHQADEYGALIENNMSEGTYNIRLVPGPSIEDQNMENIEAMNEVLGKAPQTFGLIADLYAENLPMTNNIEMRNRLRTMVPPEIIEAGKTGKPIQPKEPQPDPMLIIKQQELQLKQMKLVAEMKEAEMKAQQAEREMMLKEQELMLRSHQEGIDLSKEIEQMKMKREEMFHKLHEQELRFEAEMKRIDADLHLNHSQNVVKILTHQPNHFKASNKEMKHDS